jgi:hypothetical protein
METHSNSFLELPLFSCKIVLLPLFLYLMHHSHRLLLHLRFPLTLFLFLLLFLLLCSLAFLTTCALFQAAIIDLIPFSAHLRFPFVAYQPQPSHSPNHPQAAVLTLQPFHLAYKAYSHSCAPTSQHPDPNHNPQSQVSSSLSHSPGH